MNIPDNFLVSYPFRWIVDPLGITTELNTFLPSFVSQTQTSQLSRVQMHKSWQGHYLQFGYGILMVCQNQPDFLTKISTYRKVSSIDESCYGHLDSILVGSNEMLFAAWKYTERNRQREKKICYDFMRFRDSYSIQHF